MVPMQFRRCRGPKLLTTFSIRSIFIQCMVCFGAALALSFLIGSAAHPHEFYNYTWTCGIVHLPSISRVMNLPLERTIFQLLILYSVPLRLIALFQQWMVLTAMNNPSQIFTATNRLLVVCGGGEVLLLSLLTVIGERESGKIHMILFSLFVGLSYFYFCGLHLLTSWTSNGTESERTAIKLQRLFLFLITLAIPVISLLFIFYNVYCIAGAYELFAVFEYVTIGAMYGFHSSSILKMTGFIHVYHRSIRLRNIQV